MVYIFFFNKYKFFEEKNDKCPTQPTWIKGGLSPFNEHIHVPLK